MAYPPPAFPDQQRPCLVCWGSISATLKSSESGNRGKDRQPKPPALRLPYCLCSRLAYHIPLQLIKLKKQTQIFKQSSHWSTFMDRVLIPIQFPGDRVHSTSKVSAASLQYKFCIKQKCSCVNGMTACHAHGNQKVARSLNIDRGFLAPLLNPSEFICADKCVLHCVLSFRHLCLSTLHTHKPFPLPGARTLRLFPFPFHPLPFEMNTALLYALQDLNTALCLSSC